MTYKEEFITFMVRSGVLTFGDFTTKSGRKTPYFINTGNYKTGAQAARLGDYYAACIQEHLPEGVDCLFGPAYKGIPLAVSAAASLYRNYDRDLPYCFNRKEAKDHGEGGAMVGYKPQAGDKVVIVEDVVTAGTAVRETIELQAGSCRGHEGPHRLRGPDGAGYPELFHPGRAPGGLRHRRLSHRHRAGNHRLPPQPPGRRRRVHRRQHEGPHGGLSGAVRRVLNLPPQTRERKK